LGVYGGPSNAWSNRTDANRLDASTKVVVQSGLVLNLDAGVSSSYPGSGTTWTDLSGNGNTGTLTNGPTYSSANGGSLSFDGSNQYATIPTSANFNFGSATSVFVWHYNIGGDYRGVIANTYTTTSGFDIRYGREDYFGGTNNGTKLNVIIRSPSGSPALGLGIYSQLNVWGNYGFVYDGSSFISYKNGKQFGAVSGSVNLQPTSSPVVIGRNLNSGEYLTGKLAQASVYNRALSATEIQQNFNATRSRFSI
jgi:hypothetical protein